MKNEPSLQFVIGLGNVGEKYENTPHNLGRQLIENMQAEERLPWKKEASFDHTQSHPSYVRLNSYMNLSGKPIAELLQKFGCPPKQILICCDDFTLPLGMIRIRKKGSSGGHNGLKTIIEQLQTEDFPRLRLGIGKSEGVPSGSKPEEFVLTRFTPEQLKVARAMIEKAAQCIRTVIQDGLETAMNQFNERKKKD